MRNNISGAQAYRNALRQQYQQQVNAAVQQIAAQRAAGQQAMGNTYQQLKPTVQDNLGGFAGAIDTYNKNLKAELEAQQKAEQAAQKAWAAQAVKDIKAARKSTTSTGSTKAAADAASEESSAAENSDSLFGTPGKDSNSKPEKEDEEEKKPGLSARAFGALGSLLSAKNDGENSYLENGYKQDTEKNEKKLKNEDKAEKLRELNRKQAKGREESRAARETNAGLLNKSKLNDSEKAEIYTRVNTWAENPENKSLMTALKMAKAKNRVGDLLAAGYTNQQLDEANEMLKLYQKMGMGQVLKERVGGTAKGTVKTTVSAGMMGADSAMQTAENAVASVNNEEYRNAVKQQNSALLKMQTMEDQGLAYAYNEKGQVLGETQQYKALREQFENAKAVTDSLSSVINRPVSKDTSGYKMYQSAQEDLERSDLGLDAGTKMLKGAATSAAENIAIAAVNPALVLPVLSAQGAAGGMANSIEKEAPAVNTLANGAAKFMAGWAINSVGVEQMLDTMGASGARNTIAAQIVQSIKNNSKLAQTNPAFYAVLMGAGDNGLQSFAETWADRAIDLATNTAEPMSLQELAVQSLQEAASGALGGAMTAVAGLGVNAGRQALYNKVAGNAETAQQNVQTETAEKVADNRAPVEQNPTGQNTAVQDVINNLTTGENGGNGNTNRTAKAFYLNVSPETAQKNAENRAALAAALGVDESALPTNNKEMRQFIQGLKPNDFGKTNNYVGEIDAMMEQKQQENAEIRDNSWNGENLSGEISKMAGIPANNKEADRAVETMRESWISDEAESLYRSSNQAGDPAFTRAFDQAYRAGLDGNAQNKNTAAYAMTGEQAREIVDKAYQQGRVDRIAQNHADAAEFVPGEVLNAKHNKDLLFVDKPKDNGAQRAGKIVEKIAKAQGNRNVFWVEDAPFNGKKDGSGNIYLNANLSSGEAVRTYFGHEITHIAESSKFYKDLSKFIQDSETGKEWVRQRGFDSFDEYAEAKYRVYADKADQTGNESYRLASMDEAMQEVVADWCGENLLGDSSISERAIRELCGENRSFATKVKDFLADMVERFLGTSEEDELRHALDLFEKALGDSNSSSSDKNSVGSKGENARFSYSGDLIDDVGISRREYRMLQSELMTRYNTYNQMHNGADCISTVDKDYYLNIENGAVTVYKVVEHNDENLERYVNERIGFEEKPASGRRSDNITQGSGDRSRGYKGYTEIADSVREASGYDPLDAKQKGSSITTGMFDDGTETIGLKRQILDDRFGRNGWRGSAEKNATNGSSNSLSTDSKAEAVVSDKNGNAAAEHIRFSLSDTDSDGNTLTEQQRSYFKDSKIVDEDGNLRVVYHGSSENFNTFDVSKGRANMDIQGSFFSPWDIDAQGYGDNVRAFYLNIKKPAPEGVAYKALNAHKGENGAGIKAREDLIRMGYDGVNNSDEEYIAFYPEQIKLVDNEKPTKDSDIRYSIVQKDTISKKNRELARQNQKLTEQNERLKTSIGILKGEFKRSAGHKIADQSMNRLVSRLKGQNKSTIEREVLKQKLTKLFDYVQNAETNELNFDDVMDVTADIAKDILSNSRDTGEILRESDTRYQELYKNLGTIEVTAEEKARIEAAYGKAQFGKINGIKIKVVDKARSLEDVLHNDLAASYPEFFSGDIASAEDVFDRMAQVRSALNDPVLDNNSGMSFDEMAYSLAQQIWDEYLDMPDTRAKTYADKQADKFKAAKEEFRAQLEAQRAEAKAEYEQSLKTVQRENAAAIEQVRGETIGLRKRLAKANQELADLNKRAASQEKTIGKQAETITENKQKMRDLRSESKEAEKAARRNVNTAYDFGVADQRAVGDAKIVAKQKQIYALKADIKDRQQKMRDLRSEKNQKILETRAKYRGMMDKQRENRAKTELRNRIKKNGMALASALAKPTKSKYVPKELVRTAADLCDIIESTARTGKSRGTQYQQKLADLRTLYTQMKNSKDFDISSEYQADVDDMIQELNQKALSRNPNARTADTVTEVQSKVLSAGQFADRSLNDLTTSELAMLNNVISAIKNTISKAGQAHTKAYTLSLSETRTKAANEVKAGHRLNPKNKAEQSITNQFLNYMTPLRLFRYIGGYSGNGAVQQMYNSLNDAAVETSAIELKGNSFFSDIASDSKNLSKFSGSGADKIKLQTRNETLNDVEVEVTPAIMANMLDVWAHNPEEVERSGFVIPNLALYHNGMTKQAYANGTVIKPSAEQWLQWSADSTMYSDYAKQWSKALSEQNAFIAPKMRETQLDIQGFTNIGEGDHRTLYRDKSYVKGTTEIVGGGKTLVHDGFTKNRVEGARQPLYAMDITEFAKKTVHDTSVFAGMSAALLDFSRIYDGPVFTGQVDMDGDPISNKTLAGMIEQQYTPTATNYIKNLLDDIREQPRADQSAALGKLLGNVASASLSMNVIGTPIKQSPSFYAASSVIGLKPLLKTNAQLTKQYAITPEEIMQYTPLLALRNEQGGSQELAALKRGTGKIAGFTAKLPGTKLISWVDMHTVKALWAASADYVHSKNAALDVDSAEFKQEVAKVFNRCVQETQPNYSTLQRSEMQRSGNAFYRILGQFKTQPIQNGNILLDAYLNMKANKGSKTASKEFGQALAGQTLSLVAFVAFGNLGRLIMHQFKYWIDPDKEEVTAEQVAKAFGSDALSSVLGMIPGGTEALEIVQGYDYSNVTTSFINDFVDSSKRVYDNFPKIFDEELSDAEREAAKNKVLKGAAKIIDLTGLPASTSVRLSDAVNGWYKDITAGELNSQQKPTESVQKARLYKAYISGDEKQRTLAYDSLIGMGVRENEINSAMMTKLGSEDDMKQAAQQLADNFLESDDEIEAVISKYADMGFSEYLVRNKVSSMADSIVSKETEESKYEILDNTMDYLESNDIYNWLGEEDRAAVQQSVSGDAAKMAKQQAGYEQKYSEGEKYLAKVSGGDSDAYMKLRAAYIAANRKATVYGKSDNDSKNFYNAVTGSAYSKSLKSALLQAKNGNSKLVDASADQILAYYGASAQADTDGNSRVSQDEFKAYVQKSGMSRSAAAYVWSIRWPKSSNPYL
nr:MAG TPA: protein of unknown function (DUF5401) [Caudoviricetes sp.]